MKNIWEKINWGKIKTFFADKGSEVNTTGVADGQNVGELSAEERARRIKFAAKFTVEKYGSVIERLAKE